MSETPKSYLHLIRSNPPENAERPSEGARTDEGTEAAAARGLPV